MWPECGHKSGLWDNFLTFWPHIISELNRWCEKREKNFS